MEKGEVIRFGGQTPDELIRSLMVTMSQSGEEWRDVFKPGSPELKKLAVGLRLSDALSLSEKEGFVARFRQMEKVHNRKDNQFSFVVATTLLADVFDWEDVNRLDLPEMSKDLREWSVEVIKNRLADIGDMPTNEEIKDLIKVGDIITRSNPKEAVWGYADTYLTESDVRLIKGGSSVRQKKKIKEAESGRKKTLGEEYASRK